MPVTFSATTAGEQSELREFLAAVFGLSAVAPGFSAAAMAWKYFDANPLWPESRSYVLRTPEGIAAHGCISPLMFRVDGECVPSMQVIDWAAGQLVRGAGILIFRRCLDLTGGTLLTVGGSEDTKKIIPQLKWFSAAGEIRRYARPLRPLRIFEKSAKGPRDAARLARNLLWRARPLPSAGGWSCRSATPGDEVFSPEGDYVPIVRTREWFDYLLRCPVVTMELLILGKSGTAAGHALLAHAQGSVRVADFVVARKVTRAERAAALSAVIRHVAAREEAAEIVAASSLPEMHDTFEDCGMVSRGVSAVYVADPRKLLPPGARLEITMLVGDAFCLLDPVYPFCC